MHNCKNVKKKPTKSKDLSQFKGRVCKKVDLFYFFFSLIPDTSDVDASGL